MANYFIVQTASVPTVANGKLSIDKVYGGDVVSLDYKFISAGSTSAYSAGTAQISTATISGTITAGNVISFQLVQDMSAKNNNLADEYSALITHVCAAGDTVTTIAASIAAQVNALPFEITATSALGVATLTAVQPFNIFALAEVKDDGANLALATGTPGVAATGVKGTELVEREIPGAVSGTNYGVASVTYKGDDFVFYFESDTDRAAVDGLLNASSGTFDAYIAVI